MDAITTMEGAIKSATATMHNFFHPNLSQDKQIPFQLIQEARGLAFLTVVKAGFIWTGKVGTGLVVAKLPDGRWSAPSGIGTAGMGFGAEIGGQMIDLLIVLTTDNAVKTFMQKGQLSAGANVEFAAGPYGRAAGANANASSSGVAPNYTYSHSKGLFGGIGLQGSAIAARNDLNKKFYGRDITPTEILTGSVEQPVVATELYDAIDRATSPPENIPMATQVSVDNVPAAAIGSDIQVVYNRVLSLIDTFAGNNAMNHFKEQCKFYGQDQMTDDQFKGYLSNQFSNEQLAQILPDIVRLLNQEAKRTSLWEFYKEIKEKVSGPYQATPSLF